MAASAALRKTPRPSPIRSSPRAGRCGPCLKWWPGPPGNSASNPAIGSRLRFCAADLGGAGVANGFTIITRRPLLLQALMGFASAQPILLRPDVGRFYQRPPLFDLGLLVGKKRFRRLLRARRNVLAQLLDEPLAHGWVGHSLDDRRIELVDDGSRGGPGRPQRRPHRDVESRESGLVDRRQFGRGGKPSR